MLLKNINKIKFCIQSYVTQFFSARQATLDGMWKKPLVIFEIWHEYN